MANEYNINIEDFEPENITKDLSTKDKLNINFPKNEDNILLIKNIILEQHNRISELERKIKIMEKLS